MKAVKGLPISYLVLALLMVCVKGNLDSLFENSVCAQSDTSCMNVRARRWVNKLRRQNGVATLKSGTVAQLSNAVGHSTKQMNDGTLSHQDLLSEIFLCGDLMFAENVAQTHTLLNTRKTIDVARMCVDSFSKSSGHKANMLNAAYTHMVMGVVVTDDGTVWCTQTFWKNVIYGSGSCAKA